MHAFYFKPKLDVSLALGICTLGDALQNFFRNAVQQWLECTDFQQNKRCSLLFESEMHISQLPSYLYLRVILAWHKKKCKGWERGSEEADIHRNCNAARPKMDSIIHQHLKIFFQWQKDPYF